MSYDDDNDGGLQWWAEQGELWESERQARKTSELLQAHRKWVQNFELGSKTTNEKNADNERKETI